MPRPLWSYENRGSLAGDAPSASLSHEGPERVGAVSATPESCQPASQDRGIGSAETPRFGQAACYGTAMIRAKARLLPVLLPILATACSTAGVYPTLETRDVERITGTATPVAGEPSPADTPAPAADLVSRLDRLVAQAREADQQFRASRPAAEQATAAADGTGGDGWSSASVALARLESSRSQAMVALADLDGLYAEARSGPATGETADARAIAAARQEVGGLVAAQDEVIERLARRLGR